MAKYARSRAGAQQEKPTRKLAQWLPGSVGIAQDTRLSPTKGFERASPAQGLLVYVTGYVRTKGCVEGQEKGGHSIADLLKS